MFEPYNTTRRFDRNIFNGQGERVELSFKQPTNLLYFFRTDTIVGKLSGKIEVLVYEGFKSGNWLPIQVYKNGLDYCGWLNTEDLS